MLTKVIPRTKLEKLGGFSQTQNRNDMSMWIGLVRGLEFLLFSSTFAILSPKFYK